MLLGIDVSEFSGAIDWTRVAGSGKSFAFAKATEGRTIKDARFNANWHGMRDAGLMRGAYHLFCAVSSSAESQADAFLLALDSFEHGDLPPVLDVEEASLQGASADSVIIGMQRWIAQVEAVLTERTGTGIAAIIYTNLDTWQTLGNPTVFGSNPLWIAEPGTNIPLLPPSHLPGEYIMHQYQLNVNVPGVAGPADLDRDHRLARGACGALVRDVQQRLTDLGVDDCDPYGVDGAFGPCTEAAVRVFQAANSLPADAVVGLRTWVALLWARRPTLDKTSG